MFFFTVGMLLTAVILFLAYPFWRKTNTPLIVGQDAAMDEERVNFQIERQTLLHSLSELEVDQGQGKILQADYSRLKTVYEHQLVKVLDQLDLLAKGHPTSPSKSKRPRPRSQNAKWPLSFALGMVIVVFTSGVYALVHWKIERQQLAAAGGVGQQPPINPLEMVKRLEARLKENPNDLQGQIMAGRSYMALERWEDAEKAWRKVLELDKRNYTAHYSLGEILVRTASPGDQKVFEEALGHFDKALINVPQDPAILWARGVALFQLGRFFEADEAWTEAFQYLPPGSEGSEMVRKALQDLRAGKVPSS